MKIALLQDFNFGDEKVFSENDIVICNFLACPSMNIKNEAFEKDDKLYNLCVLSKKTNSIIILGSVIDIFDSIHKSVLVIDNGKLLGISDMTESESDSIYTLGSEYRVYQTSLGKVGVIVSHDMFNAEVFSCLTRCGSDFLVCVYDGEFFKIQSTIMSAMSYLFGIKIFFISDNMNAISLENGEIACVSNKRSVDLTFKDNRSYKIMQYLKRTEAENKFKIS